MGKNRPRVLALLVCGWVGTFKLSLKIERVTFLTEQEPTYTLEKRVYIQRVDVTFSQLLEVTLLISVLMISLTCHIHVSTVSATPSSTLSKRPREEDLDNITVELESQEEPAEPPISKKLRMQRVELEVWL